MAKDPCSTSTKPWRRAYSPTGRTDTTSKNGGKWLLFIDHPYIWKVWTQVVADLSAGLLGSCAKVSMCQAHSPLAIGGGHVICVYTKSWKDRDDVLRVAKQLVSTAALKKMRISYKSDAQTLDGVYKWNSSSVALYIFGPPYQALTVPKAPNGRK